MGLDKKANNLSLDSPREASESPRTDQVRPAAARILVLDDQPAESALIARYLSQANDNYYVKQVSDIDCMAAELESDYDIVFLDLHLDSCTGLELVRDQLQGLPHFPIVLLTNDDNPEVQAEALELGIADFISKRDVSAALLEKSVRYSTNLYKQYRLKDQMSALERALSVDPLTGLNTASYCFLTLDKLLKQDQHNHITVMACQITDINNISRSLGNQDETLVLQQYHQWLAAQAPDHCTIGCTHDNQLLVIMPNDGADKIDGFCNQLAKQLIPINLNGEHKTFSVTHSIGTSSKSRQDKTSSHTLIQAALTALDAAKQGRKAYETYSPERHKKLEQRAVITRDITQAIESHEIHFEIQPQFRVNDASLSGGEMLMRWDHPELGPINPQMLVDAAEATQQILTLGKYALNAALEQLENWLATGRLKKGFRLAVNVSAAELESEGYFDAAAAALTLHSTAAQYLELELTESIHLADPPQAGKLLAQLREFGVTIAIDDFGTAHANLGNLCFINADIVKLDRSILVAADEQGRARSIYQSASNMLHNVNAKIVAEGIETPSQMQLAREVGIDIVQGYLLSHPLTVAAFEQLLDDHNQQPGFAKAL